MQALTLVTQSMDFEAGAVAAGMEDDDAEGYSDTTGLQLNLLEKQSVMRYEIDPEFTALLMKVENKVENYQDNEAIEQAWEDLMDLRPHDTINWKVMLECLYDNQRRTEKQTAFVINPLRLTVEKRARLWHWRLAHANHDAPVRLTKSGIGKDVNVTCTLNKDCPICDKAKFRRLPFTPH